MSNTVRDVASQVIDSTQVCSIAFSESLGYNDSMINDNEYLLPGSEELSREFNDLASYYSDYHKDTYGYRPRGMSLCADQYANEAELLESLEKIRTEISYLDEIAPGIWEKERANQQKAIESFEAEVSLMISHGAEGRRDAIAWICIARKIDIEDDTYGWEDLEYTFGIPWGYIKKSIPS